jgi:hypothetical protein
MKQIDLSTKKYPNTFALVDDEDYNELAGYNWFAHDDNDRTIYVTRNTVKEDSGGRTQVLMHRQIVNAGVGWEVDHIDRNGLNNQRSNLRLCTKSQNQHNANMRSDNTSGFKGVSRAKGARSWQARIRVDGKLIHLGSFSEKSEAAKAYDEVARKYFGEFARTNFALEPVK